MVTKEFFGGRTVRCDNGTEAELLYYLTWEEQDGCIGYGAEIIMHRGGTRDSALVPNITTSKIRMGQILSLLCRNTVTPCALHDVIDEQLHKF